MEKVAIIQTSIQSGLPAPLPDERRRHKTRPNETPKNVADYIVQHISKSRQGTSQILKKYCIMTMDLQQTMPLPRLSTSTAFYIRQMWFYNLGIHIIAKYVDKTVFCMWTEDQAGRGRSEIFSSLLRITEVDVSLKEKYHLILWTD
ncbi:hypothetical protein PR048_001860 [Dryococelus australis]|uniref:Uncharacterized protein n=1 Tax=Dryococelus australis TaxID=614101 RepID=A0ABQ9IIP9_9NEOP|nr:hypothetical protein PR048_001860 [Dryococelus australis]